MYSLEEIKKYIATKKMLDNKYIQTVFDESEEEYQIFGVDEDRKIVYDATDEFCAEADSIYDFLKKEEIIVGCWCICSQQTIANGFFNYKKDCLNNAICNLKAKDIYLIVDMLNLLEKNIKG